MKSLSYFFNFVNYIFYIFILHFESKTQPQFCFDLAEKNFTVLSRSVLTCLASSNSRCSAKIKTCFHHSWVSFYGSFSKEYRLTPSSCFLSVSLERMELTVFLSLRSDFLFKGRVAGHVWNTGLNRI